MTVEREYTEGKTTFLTADVDHYSGDKAQPTTSMPVFYNPRMRVNRDLSVLFLETYLKSEAVKLVCEPLAGSGVRTLRYLNECSGNFNAHVFDANPLAISTAKKNFARYGFEERVKTECGDAKVLLLSGSRGKRYDFVDVDPFGTPVPYLNASIQSMDPKGGLLALTATDMPALCGVYPRVAMRKYGGLSIRAPISHEIALRLLLGRTCAVAGMNDFSISPQVALSTDHYIRVWVTSRADCKGGNRQVSNIGFIEFCPGCLGSKMLSLSESFERDTFVHQHEGCTNSPSIAGPLWTGRLYNPKFMELSERNLSDYKTVFHKRTLKIFQLILEEYGLTEYQYVDIHRVCDVHSFTPPKMSDVLKDLQSKGFKASRTHFQPTAIRTEAPVKEIVDSIKGLQGALD